GWRVGNLVLKKDLSTANQTKIVGFENQYRFGILSGNPTQTGRALYVTDQQNDRLCIGDNEPAGEIAGAAAAHGRVGRGHQAGLADGA
ncbi:MAG: hypothetical protein ACPGZU_19200, partial [Ketobacter sp.]